MRDGCESLIDANYLPIACPMYNYILQIPYSGSVNWFNRGIGGGGSKPELSHKRGKRSQLLQTMSSARSLPSARSRSLGWPSAVEKMLLHCSKSIVSRSFPSIYSITTTNNNQQINNNKKLEENKERRKMKGKEEYTHEERSIDFFLYFNGITSRDLSG